METKRCRTCKEDLSLECFPASGVGRVYYHCKSCMCVRRIAYCRKGGNSLNRKWCRDNPEKALLSRTKRKAKIKGLDHNLELVDIIIPKTCPVLGVPLTPRDPGLEKGKVWNNTPSVDRIDNSRGYVKGNIIIVSWRANNLKSDANPEELRKLADFYSKL